MVVGMRTGRPQFQPTKAQRRAIEQMSSVGEPASTMATAIGVDRKTLAKSFAAELLVGRAKRRREVIDLLFRAARAGNVSALKKLELMTAITPPPVGPRIGKKERAEAEVEGADVGTSWGHLLH